MVMTTIVLVLLVPGRSQASEVSTYSWDSSRSSRSRIGITWEYHSYLVYLVSHKQRASNRQWTPKRLASVGPKQTEMTLNVS